MFRICFVLRRMNSGYVDIEFVWVLLISMRGHVIARTLLFCCWISDFWVVYTIGFMGLLQVLFNVWSCGSPGEEDEGRGGCH